MFRSLLIGFIIFIQDIRHKKEPYNGKKYEELDQYNDPHTAAP